MFSILAAESAPSALPWAAAAAKALKGLHVEAVLLPLLWQVG